MQRAKQPSWRAGALIRAACLCGLAASACAEDVILPVTETCGDLLLDSGEECDLDSPGCDDCRVVPGFRCDEQTCEEVCGDERVVGTEECDPPDGLTCDSSCRAGEKTEACDLSGYWIARNKSFARDDVVNQVQTTSSWNLFVFSQTGDEVRVEKSLYCGLHVTGSATVDTSDKGVRSTLYASPQGAESPHQRTGTFARGGSGCEFTLARQYTVRGLEASFLPPDPSARPDLVTLPPLPYEEDPETPTGDHVTGAIDVDGDGILGLAYQITGNASGVRNVVQRDWDEFSTPEGYPIPTHALEFVARYDFDTQEEILHVTRCPVIGCGVILASGVPEPQLRNRATLRYLGPDLDTPRVREIVEGEPYDSAELDFRTCRNVRAALPHDPARE